MRTSRVSSGERAGLYRFELKRLTFQTRTAFNKCSDCRGAVRRHTRGPNSPTNWFCFLRTPTIRLYTNADVVYLNRFQLNLRFIIYIFVFRRTPWPSGRNECFGDRGHGFHLTSSKRHFFSRIASGF